MKKTTIDYSKFVRRQKPYRAQCAHCRVSLEGDSKEEVIKQIKEEKWGVIQGTLYCNECYHIFSWE